MTAGPDMPHPSHFAQGTHDYPDRSATLVLQVEDIRAEGPVMLSGPGIPQRLRFGASGLGDGFWAAMAENHAGFPIGVDVIFVSPTSIAALPRSTDIELAESL
jgi:alpha-D-ribose 1-methylphosphonate 5-triphosphate synthase subunit PhnH